MYYLEDSRMKLYVNSIFHRILITAILDMQKYPRTAVNNSDTSSDVIWLQNAIISHNVCNRIQL